MDIQYLNGIDIQYLNGGEEYQHTLDANQRTLVNKLNRKAKHNAERRRAVVTHMTKGVTNAVAKKAEMVANGQDFAGFAGDGGVADAERLRNYLQHTLEVTQDAPIMLAGYQNPRALGNQINYVLKMWDTPYREQAIDNVIAEEERGVAMGAIDTNVAEDANEPTMEDWYDIDGYVHGVDGIMQKAKTATKKNTFFKAVKKALKPSLTTEAQDIVASNPATTKRKALNRQRVAQVRAVNPTTTAQQAQVSGLMGEDDIDMLISGTDLEYAITGENALDCIKRYLERTRYVAQNYQGEFESAEQAQQTIACIDQLLRIWHNDSLRNKVFNNIEQTQGLGGFLKKIAKAVKKVTVAPVKATITATKKVAQAVAKVAKKVGKAVAKVAKKVWKLVVRFNPLTLLIRAGILGFCRLNMFKVANKCYIGSLSKEEALKKGATAEEWEKSNKAYGHLKNAYTKIGGKESKLKSVLSKGNKKKWTGTEYPTDANAIKDASKNISEADNKEAQADMDYDETMKEYQSKGYISDSTISTDVATLTKNEEVTIIENERTTKDTVKLYEGDDKAKVLVTIPKATKVLVDVKETSNGLIACTYNGKNGWVEQSGLAGLGECDAESVAVLGIGGIYDDDATNGLGEPATATAIASATSVIASIMAKIKNIFGTAKSVVDTAKNAVNVVKETKDAVKSGDVEKAVNNITNVVNDPKSIMTAQPTTATTTQPANKIAQFVQNVAQKGAQVVQTIKSVTQPQEQSYVAPDVVTAQQPTTTATTTQAITATQQATPQQSNTKKYLLIGGGAVALGVIGYLLLRKK